MLHVRLKSWEGASCCGHQGLPQSAILEPLRVILEVIKSLDGSNSRVIIDTPLQPGADARVSCFVRHGIVNSSYTSLLFPVVIMEIF